jgi:hypothetical protein
LFQSLAVDWVHVNAGIRTLLPFYQLVKVLVIFELLVDDILQFGLSVVAD